MDFSDAIKFAKKFPTCRPKVFKGFVEWGVCDTETEGYVVLAEAALAKGLCVDELEDYVKSHKLGIGSGNDYLMIYTLF
jgi:hypothetical protein